jgi:uncharacterized peroxidase-related enzyme
MSRLPMIDPTQANGAAGDQLARTHRELGLVPNMTKAMANSPALLQGYLDLSTALAKGTLDAGVRELIAVTVAESNECGYCLSAHAYLGEHVAKIPADEVELARDARSSDPHTQAVLALAEAIVADRGNVHQNTLDAVRAAGVTDAQIAETVGHVAINLLTNYFNRLAHPEIDWPVVSPRGRAA